MRNNETGEFEMVLGNRQLISGFFIVVILFGIFFAMGYIVGRNSAPSPRMQAEASLPNVPETRPPAAGAAPVTASPGAPTGEQTPPSDAKPPGDGSPQPTTQPAPGAETPPPPAAAEPAGVASPMPVAEPSAAGTYLQVIAARQPEAESVARSLKDKSLPASLSPGPNGLVRVLVGPYQDKASLGKAKAELENAGFHPMVKK